MDQSIKPASGDRKPSDTSPPTTQEIETVVILLGAACAGGILGVIAWLAT